MYHLARKNNLNQPITARLLMEENWKPFRYLQRLPKIVSGEMVHTFTSFVLRQVFKCPSLYPLLSSNYACNFPLLQTHTFISSIFWPLTTVVTSCQQSSQTTLNFFFLLNRVA